MGPVLLPGPVVNIPRPLDDARVQESSDNDQNRAYAIYGAYARQELERERREEFQASLNYPMLQSMIYAVANAFCLQMYPSAAGYALDPCNEIIGPLESFREYDVKRVCQDSRVIHKMLVISLVALIAYPILGLVALSTKENYYKSAKAIKALSGLALVGAAVESGYQGFLLPAATTLFCAATVFSQKFEKKTVGRFLESKTVRAAASHVIRGGIVVGKVVNRFFTKFLAGH